jgi:PsbP
MLPGSRPKGLIRSLLLLVLLCQWNVGSCAWSWANNHDAAKKVSIENLNHGPHHATAGQPNRRRLLAQFALGLPVALPLIALNTQGASATTKAEEIPAAFVRQTSDFAYVFTPPSGFASPSQKPIKTHLDEVNFKNDNDKAADPAASAAAATQFGITVDPLRIGSLSEFGTPEEVAAKVVLAEVNRDGVFDVTLMEDPFAGGGGGNGGDNSADDNNDLFYQLNYRSNGKRGVKRYVAKFYVRHQKLFALTAQCNEDAYEANKGDILKAVESFKILPSQ